MGLTSMNLNSQHLYWDGRKDFKRRFEYIINLGKQNKFNKGTVVIAEGRTFKDI